MGDSGTNRNEEYVCVLSTWVTPVGLGRGSSTGIDRRPRVCGRLKVSVVPQFSPTLVGESEVSEGVLTKHWENPTTRRGRLFGNYSGPCKYLIRKNFYFTKSVCRHLRTTRFNRFFFFFLTATILRKPPERIGRNLDAFLESRAVMDRSWPSYSPRRSA